MDRWHQTLEEEAHMVLDAVEIMQRKYGYHEPPFNQTTIGVFIKLSLMDIFLLYKMLFKCEEEREKNIIARTLAIHISEFIDDVGKLVGKPLADASRKYQANPELQLAIKNIRVWYNSIREKYKSMLNIRNIVSAHKDRNVILQLATNENINIDEIHILVILNFQFFAAAFQKYEKLLIKCIQRGQSVTNEDNSD